MLSPNTGRPILANMTIKIWLADAETLAVFGAILLGQRKYLGCKLFFRL